MLYKEPGPYLYLENNPKYNTGVTPSLIPVILGEGLDNLTKTVSIVRSSETYDLLPFSNVVSIDKVGNLKDSEDYVISTDYTLHTDGDKIDWSPAGEEPAVGDTYYVTLTYTPGNDHYEPKLMSSKDQVEETYGPDVDESGAINKVSLAAQICLDYANLVYVCQVKKSGATIAATDYQAALDQYIKYLPDAYRIIPADLQADINLKIIKHVDLMSTPEERMERVTILGADHTSEDATAVITNVGGYAETIANKRVSVIYPDQATRQLSDGNYYTLDAPMIAAALAGWKCAQPTARAFTKGQLTSFYELSGIKMSRTEKNLLAAKGVMILDQNMGAGTPIEVRHGLTTDMSSLQTKEASVIEVGDYCAKYLRDGLSSYIGKYNVTPDLIVRLKGTTKSLLSILSEEKVIISGEVSALYQDEVNPDTVIIKVIVKVPYPCNYIEITLFLD